MTSEIEVSRRSEASVRSQFDHHFSEYISRATKSTDTSVDRESQRYSLFLLSYADSRQCEFWTARDSQSGEIIARLGADVSKSMKSLGSVGFFDCEPTSKGKLAAHLLLSDAFTWLKKNGTKTVYGPMDFNSWFRYRFKIKDSQIDTPDFPWEPPPSNFHIEVFKEAGFKEHTRYSSFFFEVSSPEAWDAYIARLKPDHSRVLDNGFTISEIRFDENLDSDLRKIFVLLNNAFAQSPMFEAIPFEIFSQMIISTLKSNDCSGSRICFSQDGDLVAFLFAFVSKDTSVFKTIAVHPYFQSLGIGNALTLELAKTCREMGILKSAGALIRSGNSSEMIGHGFSKYTINSRQHQYILMKREPL